MGISREQAVQNRAAVVGAAEKLFRQRGVDAIGLNDLMDAAGFTRGGFYNHFKSKDALVVAVMEKAMQDGAARLDEGLAASQANGRDPLEGRIDWYLSAEHRDDIESGCPLSGFAGDVRRLGNETMEHYASGLEFNLKLLANLVAAPDDTAASARAKAIAMFSEMVGTLLLARAVADAAPELSDEILEAGRQHLQAAARPARRRAKQAR